MIAQEKEEAEEVRRGGLPNVNSPPTESTQGSPSGPSSPMSVGESSVLRTSAIASEGSLPENEIPHPHWNTEELSRDFEVIGFAAPLVVVKKKSTGEKGSLMFKHHPRIYFGWKPHQP